MVRIAERTAIEARHAAVNARWTMRGAAGRATGKTVAMISELERTRQLVERVAAHPRLGLLSGETPAGATRIVSLHDPGARPIAKVRLGHPVEFGYKAQVVDNADGVVVDHEGTSSSRHASTYASASSEDPAEVSAEV